jgi:LysM repeat protein
VLVSFSILLHAISEEESMFRKFTIIIAIAIASVVLLSACFRSASPPKLATPTATGAISTSASVSLASPTPTSINLIEAWGTTTAVYVQTAIAQGTITAVPATQTPQPSPTQAQASPTSTPILPATGVASETPVAGVATSTPLPGNTPVIVVPTSTPGRPATYTLHEGEFPYCLARRFDVNQNEIMTLNGFVEGQLFKPGLVVQIPQTGYYVGNRALHPHPAQYTVQVDDTFYSIACYFGDVDPTSIAAANNLSISSILITGSTLNIP